MTEAKESVILVCVDEMVKDDTPARIAWGKITSVFGQNPFKGRNTRERRENFSRLYASAKDTPVAFRLGLLNARRQDLLNEMIETAMKQDVPAEDCEDFVQDFKKAQQYPNAIPEALESLAEFNKKAADDFLQRAKELWPQLNPMDDAKTLETPTTPVLVESNG